MIDSRHYFSAQMRKYHVTHHHSFLTTRDLASMKLWQRFWVSRISLLSVAIFLWQSESFSLLIFSTFLYCADTFLNSSSRFQKSIFLAVSSFCSFSLWWPTRVSSSQNCLRIWSTSMRFLVYRSMRCFQSQLLSQRLESPVTIIVFWLRLISAFSSSSRCEFSLNNRYISFSSFQLLSTHLFFSLLSFSKSLSSQRYLLRHCFSFSLNSYSTFSRMSLSFSRSASRSLRQFFHLLSRSLRDSKCSFLSRAVYSCSSLISLFLSSLEVVSLLSCWLRKAILA